MCLLDSKVATRDDDEEEVHIYGPRIHIMHEVGMLPTSAQLVYTQSLPQEIVAQFRFWGRPAVAPCRLAGSAPHKSGGRRVKSCPDDTHTHKHTPVIWICDLGHKQINKKQTSIRCNHTQNTHWVNLKCTHIQQRQYKPDWRCTIHTQNVTTTPSTDNTAPTTNKPPPTHLLTTINQRTKSNQHIQPQKQNRGT